LFSRFIEWFQLLKGSGNAERAAQPKADPARAMLMAGRLQTVKKAAEIRSLARRALRETFRRGGALSGGPEGI
jgi:hypothetical protein